MNSILVSAIGKIRKVDGAPKNTAEEQTPSLACSSQGRCERGGKGDAGRCHCHLHLAGVEG